MNYVYERDYAVLVRLKVPASASGTIPIRAEARWLACTDKVCVPEQGDVRARPAGRKRRSEARDVRRMAPGAAPAAGSSGALRAGRRPAAHRDSAPGQRRRSSKPYVFPLTDGAGRLCRGADLPPQAVTCWSPSFSGGAASPANSPACSRSATGAGSSSPRRRATVPRRRARSLAALGAGAILLRRAWRARRRVPAQPDAVRLPDPGVEGAASRPQRR